MKQIITIYFLLIIISLGVCGSCTQASKKEKNTGRVYFTINPKNRTIQLPIVLNDSITANLNFDSAGHFVLDSTFCASHPSITAGLHLIGTSHGSVMAWVKSNLHRTGYEGTPSFKIGNTNLKEIDDRTMVYNWKRYIADSISDGLFNIPPMDTTHVWEINFEHNYMEVHSAKYFSMPENCFVTPMVEPKKFGHNHIKLPIKIRCANGDTLTLYRTYFIDTGAAMDIILMGQAKELDFFNKQKDAVWTMSASSGGVYNRHYTVDGTLFNDFKMDSLRIYTLDHDTRFPCDYLIGLNFLKRFNVFFDMKNHQVGLQPIKNFQRVINPLHIRFHFWYGRTHRNTILVTKVADYKANYYKTAGLREGDEIVAINGKQYKWITLENYEEFRNQDTLLLDVIRKGESLKIVVPVNKNEVQGD